MTKNKIKRQNRFLFKAVNDNGKEFDIIAFEIIMGMAERGYDMGEVRKAFQSCGLPEEYIGEVTKPGMMGRAIQATVNQLANSDFKYVKVGNEGSDLEVYKIFKKESFSKNGKLDANMVPYALINYNRGTETITTDNQEIDSMLTNNYRYYMMNYTNADVSRYVRTMLEREAMCISLRKQGGAYIVPAKDHDLIMKVRAFFDKIDPNGDFHVTELPDLNGAKEATAAAFERKIQDVKEDIEAKLDKMKEGGKDMSKTIRNNLFEEVVALGKELELMMDITEYDMVSGKDTLTEINSMIVDYSAA